MNTYLNSEKEFEKAQRFIPGGVNSPVRAFGALGRNPIFMEKGKGAILTDIDGNLFIDYCLSWGVHILGHAHNNVIKAAIDAIQKSSSFGAPTRMETTLAELIISAVPSVEKIRFVSSGTEAVMSALRLAKGFTGRDKIIKFDGCYHGHSDSLLVSAGSGLATQNLSASAGIPVDFLKHTISLPFNDIEAITNAFDKYGKQIAAIILEPFPANMGVVIPKPEFLKTLRTICTANNSVLIFDEVITGFRLSMGGAQEITSITPDLTTFGKIIGGGFPVGAFGGKAEIMSQLAPIGPVYQAGTLSGNPVAMSAGIAVMQTLLNDMVHSQIHAKANTFFSSLAKIADKHNLVLNHTGSMFTLFFTKNKVVNFSDAQTCNLEKFKLFYNKLLDRGIYLSPSQFEASFISATHSEIQLEKTLTSIDEILNEVM